MIICPNINSSDWKNLVKSQGENVAYFLWNKYEGNIPEKYYTSNSNIKTENESEVGTWFSKNLPQVPREVVETLKDINGYRVDAWGYYFNNVITVVKNAKEGTSYHEAFHAVFRNMVSSSERQELVSEAYAKYGMPSIEELDALKKDYGQKAEELNITDDEPFVQLWLEEKLADDFADYVKYPLERTKDSIWTKIRDFFRRILEMFGLATTKNTVSKIEQVFNKINTGGFSKAKFGSNKISTDVDSLLEVPMYNRKKNIKNIGANYKAIRAKSIADQFKSTYLSNIKKGIEEKPNDIFTKIFDSYRDRAEALIEDPTNENRAKVAKMLFMLEDIEDEEGNVVSTANEVQSILINEAISILKDQGIIIKGEAVVENKIEKDVEGTEIPTEEQEVREMESHTTKGLSDYTSIPGLSHASTRLKLALSTLRKYKEGTTEFEYDDIGDPIYLDMLKTYYFVERNLLNQYSLEEQINALEELTDVIPELQQLIEQLTDPSKHISEQAYEMFRNDFKTNFTKQQLKYTLVLFSREGGTYNVKIIDANRRDIMSEISNEWKANLLRKDKNTIAVFDDKTDSWITRNNERTEQLSNYWQSLIEFKENITKKQIADTLYKLGIELENKVLDKIINEDKIKVVDKISDIIQEVNSEEVKATLERKAREARNFFIQKEANERLDLFTSSFNDADNKNIYTIQLPTFVSEFVSKLNGSQDKFDTLIAELKRDPFYKYNNLLKYLEENPDFRENTFRMSIMDGLKGDTSNKGTKFMKMDHKDFIFSDLALFANVNRNKQAALGTTNKHIYLAPADKKLQMIFDLPTIPVSLVGKELGVGENQLIHDKFRNVIAGEIARIKSALADKTKDPKDLIVHYHYKKGTDPKVNISNGLAFKFLTLPSLNKYKMGEKTLISRIIDYIEQTPEASVEDIINDFVADIDLAITQSLNTELKKQLNLLEKYNLIKKTSEGYKDLTLPNGFVDKTENAFYKAIATYTFNKLLNNIELSNLLNGDPAMYKANDLLKRTYQSNSMVSKGDTSGELKIAVVKDVEFSDDSKPQLYNSLEDSINKLKPFLKKGAKDRILKQYKETNATDATTWQHPESWKREREARGNWNAEYELAYKIAEGIITNPTEQQLTESRALLAGEKPFGFGNIWNEEQQKYTPVQIKTFFVPLFKSLIKDNPLLQEKRKQMDEQGIDILVTDSVLKGFMPTPSSITDSITPVLTVPRSIIGIQVDNVQHLVDEENDAQRQIKMLAHGAIEGDKQYTINNIGEISGNDLHKTLDTLEAVNIENDANKVKQMFDSGNGELLFNIYDALTRRNATDAVHKLFEIVDNDFKFPLFMGPFNIQGQNMISSIWTKKVSKQKFNGGSAVSISSLGFQFRNLQEQQNNLPEEYKKLQSSLNPVFKEDGTLDYWEAAMPAYSSEFFNVDGTLKDINQIPEELRTFITYRIPTEGLHSIVPIKVVKFLAPELGNFMLLPLDITTQLGEDFDFDKRYFSYKHFYKDKEGNLKVVKYKEGNSTKDINDRYKIYKESVEKDYQKMLKKAQVENFDEAIILALRTPPNLMSLEEFSNLSIEAQNTKEARDNRILDIYSGLLKSVHNFETVFTKSNFDKLQEIKGEFEKEFNSIRTKLVNEGKLSEEEIDNYFSAAQQTIIKVRNATGADMKGQVANHVTAHAFYTKLGAQLKKGSVKFNENDYTNLSQVFSGDLHIGDRLGQLLAGVLDDLKNPFLAFLGINNETVDIYGLLIRLGLDEKSAINFTASPIVKEITTKLGASNSQIKGDVEGRYTVDTQIKNNSTILRNIEDLLPTNIVENYSFDKKALTHYINNGGIPRVKNSMKDFVKVDNTTGTAKYSKYLGLEELRKFGIENEQLLKEISLAVSSKEVDEILTKNNLKNDVEKLELIYNYFLGNQRTTLAFKGYKTLADALVKSHKFFAINKELGPDIESLLDKLYTYEEMMSETFPIEYTSNLRVLNQLKEAAEKALDLMSQHYPYKSTTYERIKAAIAEKQLKLFSDEATTTSKLLALKKDLRVKTNGFIDYFRIFETSTFKDLNTPEAMQKIFEEVPMKVIKLKSVHNIDKYGDLRTEPLLYNLKVKEIKGTKFKAIQLAGNRQDLSVKNAFTNSMLDLYKDPIDIEPGYTSKDLVLDLIKYSLLYSGFNTGLDSFHSYIDPEILSDLNLDVDQRNSLRKAVKADQSLYNVNETDHIVDLLIRNNPVDFTRTISDRKLGKKEKVGDKVLYKIDSKKHEGLTTISQIVIGKVAIDEDTKVDVYADYIRIKFQDTVELYKQLPETKYSNEKVYERVSMLGKRGYLIEAPAINQSDKSIIVSNNYEFTTTREKETSLAEDLGYDVEPSDSNLEESYEENPSPDLTEDDLFEVADAHNFDEDESTIVSAKAFLASDVSNNPEAEQDCN